MIHVMAGYRSLKEEENLDALENSSILDE